MITVALGLVCLLAVAGINYWLGYRLGYKRGYDAAEQAQSRLLQLDPPDRTPGLPTNIGEASQPRPVRWRSGQFRSGPPQR